MVTHWGFIARLKSREQLTIRKCDAEMLLFLQVIVTIRPCYIIFSGSQVFDANATDSDTGLDGQLEYTITGGLNGGIDFTIDLQEGWVFVGAELDRETRDLYVLNLTVQDRALKESDRRSTTMEVRWYFTF